MYFIDFETMPIAPRPDYPPEPVCVSIKGKDRTPQFVFGKDAMQKALAPIFNSKSEMCFHNAAFDLSVATHHLGMPMPHWKRIHDTKFLLFLYDPYANLSLKPAAAEILGIGEEDQEDLRDWIYEHIPEAKGKKSWGKWIGYAPESLLKKRAHGDTLRTEALYDELIGDINEAGMSQAYERERRLLPMLMKNSDDGVRVDRKKILTDLGVMEKALVEADRLICKKLNAPNLNPGSPAQLIEAIEHRGLGGNWLKTKGGKDSASKNSLLQGVTDKELLSLLQYRGKVDTALTTFLRKWADQLSRTFDRLHTDWNQVKGEGAGAATGRKSSTPNFQNIPKLLKADDLAGTHGLPAIPRFRYYFLPEEGEVWLRRDFSQQELRILAHMSGGNLLKMYQDNPRIDFHQYAADNLAHLDLMRPDVQIKVNRYDDARGIAKMIAFSILYGMGLTELAYRLGIDDAEARKVKQAYLDLFPGLQELDRELKFRAKANKPISTWGGRLYYCQEPKFIEGRLRKFDYKLLNYLIQGSAADCTKEALCRLHEAGLPGRFLLSVHDEISWSIPGNQKQVREAAREIGRIMTSIEFEVPMLSDAELGPSWGSVKKVEGI